MLLRNKGQGSKLISEDTHSDVTVVLPGNQTARLITGNYFIASFPSLTTGADALQHMEDMRGNTC